MTKIQNDFIEFCFNFLLQYFNSLFMVDTLVPYEKKKHEERIITASMSLCFWRKLFVLTWAKCSKY